LHGDGNKSRPFVGEIVVKNLLEDGYQLLADLWWGGGKDRKQTVSKSLLLIFGYRLVLREVLAR
jgi:hypothetical protein